LASRLGLFASG